MELKDIHTIIDIIDGYSKVDKQLEAVYKLTAKAGWELPVICEATIVGVFNKFSANIEIYKKTVGTDAHEAHGDALIEVQNLMRNQGADCPDVRERIKNDAHIIWEEIIDLKYELKKFIDNL